MNVTIYLSIYLSVTFLLYYLFGEYWGHDRILRMLSQHSLKLT